MQTDGTNRDDIDFSRHTLGSVGVVIIVLLILLSVFWLFIKIDGVGGSNQRIERLEYVMSHSKFYMDFKDLYYIDENMTLLEVKVIYNEPSNKPYKRMGTVAGLNYICDGTGEDQIELMLK